MNGDEMVVTPWEVSGEIDYEKLIREFGTKPLTDDLLERLGRYAGGLHMMLRRRVFFSHRDLDLILDAYDDGREFILYTGRGPSGQTHLGHLIPWIFTKHLQDVFSAKLYFQFTDDEKFLISHELTREKAMALTYENALDVMAVGFDPERTILISNMRNAGLMYNRAIEIARHVTLSTAKAVFGFKDSSNIGIIFFPALQAVPCFLESIFEERDVPCLIPAAIDQDPYWRIARDVAPKLGFSKPAQIHCRFLPGLGKGGKMSSSMPETCIFTTDDPKSIERKIMNAFTGGGSTISEHRERGGRPQECPIFLYEYLLFEEDDAKVGELMDKCRRGEILCGECKAIVAEKVKRFIERHQEMRERARGMIEDLFLDRYLERRGIRA
jgi:tryptophanyl-tRNA synthetase